MGQLVLEDGAVYEGESIGISGEVIGPVVIDRRVVGYQEIMTDPANAGKIMCLTYPLIGNYGISEKFNESERAWIKSLVIKEKSKIYSNWQATTSLDEFLKKEKIVALAEVDTRTLGVKIRDDGEMLGIVSTEKLSVEELLKKIEDFKNKKEKNSFLPQISVEKIKKIQEGRPRIVVIDLGIPRSFLEQVSALGCEIVLVPYNSESQGLLGLNPDGIIISNGPEDDPALQEVVSTVKQLLGKIPLLGISTGHEIICAALGGKIIRLKAGHRGVNYPIRRVKNLEGGGEITVQNHSLIVEEKSLTKKNEVEIVERNLNDDSIEKIVSKKWKFISIQYYPASPGLGEIHPVFKEFLQMVVR